jgi:5-methylcytosine-specific restriction endonuclease McrA
MAAGRLTTLGNRLGTKLPQRVASTNVSERRITGTTLQRIRQRIWADNPHCAMCGRLTAYPHGFELDHIVRLEHGGADTDHNRQVLCVWYDEQGRKAGCHVTKTREEGGSTRR